MRDALGPMGLSLLWFALLVGCMSDEKFNVNNAIPAAVILSHSAGDGVREGEVLTLVGSVTDATHAAEDLTATWSADGVTACEGTPPEDDGTTTCEVAVPAGDDLAVQLEVRDPKGASGSASVDLVITETEAPLVDLVAPEDGGVFLLGEAIAFEATVTDGEDEPGDLTVWFESSVDGRIEITTPATSAGELAGVLDLSLGSHDLALWAEDTDGKTNRDRVSITIEEVPDDPPTAEILTPEEGTDAVYYTGELISLSGLAGDAEDASTDLLAEWSSSLDGILDVDTSVQSDGSTSTYATLTEGDHVVSLTVTDTAGQTVSDSVVIAVGPPNSAPLCEITAPETGTAVVLDDLVVFEATASDPDVPSDWLSASWSSDEDGHLGDSTPSSAGEIAFPIDTLSANTHTITLTVTDEVGSTCTDFVLLAVSTPPELVVSAPVVGATVNQGEPVTFAATVTDAEDPASALTVDWDSSLDGSLSSGPPDSGGSSSFISDALSVGTHTLTITVTDTDGMYATAVQSLVVNSVPTAPVVAITPEAPQTEDAILAIMVTPSTDDEGDTVAYTYAWARDGVDMGISAASVTATETAKGQVWTVSVSGSDAMSTGPAGTASVEILNTVHTAPTVSISPAAPIEGEDDLICGIDIESSDVDGDLVSYAITWAVDGVPYTDAITTTRTGDTISAVETIGDEEWTCTVTPTDGESDGASVDASTVIEAALVLEYIADHGGTMIKIDAQTFEMGCTAGMSSCGSDESPAHFVTLTNDFFIGETEVTQGEYEAMMGTNPSDFSSCGSDCPVNDVSWHMSAAFANGVSDSEGLEQCYSCIGSGTSTNCSIAVDPYSCDGYRLPTEAEWEAAARCGEDTLYAGSTAIGDVAWYDGNSGSTPHTVATKASNACGLYDMSGNVGEWNQDWYSSSYYSSSPGTDPVGAPSGDSRVLRGGSWSNHPAYTRVAVRERSSPAYRHNGNGLRLLRTALDP